jgi:hypothetical protein
MSFIAYIKRKISEMAPYDVVALVAFALCYAGLALFILMFLLGIAHAK